MASFTVDPAFADVGKAPGLTIWRIENLKPVPTEPESYGKFFSGDSYIILNTYNVKSSSALSWDIHFWLGKETTHDEKGVAAYKTCELDAAVGGFATQYRETQDHESNKFLSLFKSSGGIMYLEGGIDGGFRHVEGKEYPTRLLHLKGRRNVRVKEVKCTRESMNLGDVFILDLGLMLYQWNGPEANRMEKAKGLEVCTRLRNDRGGNPVMQTLDGPDCDCDSFWDQLGGKGPVASADAGGSDAAEEKKAAKELQLFEVGEGGELSKVEKEKGRLTRAMCTSELVYLLDTGTTIYVWSGKNSSKTERKESLNAAQAYITSNSRPTWTQVVSVMERAESPEFKGYFFQWDPPFKPSLARRESTGVAKTPEQKEIDVQNLLKKKAMEEIVVDDASGSVEMWRIENFEKVPVPDDKYGQFFAGDSYIVLYTYKPKQREEYILYFWQGRHSTNDEKGASALLAKDMDDKLGGRATQVRVVQGKEPGHFCSLFKGKMIVHAGGIASGFSKGDGSGAAEGDSYDTDGVMFYQCKGTSAINTHAVQVEEKASSLYSGDSFILVTPNTVYEWYGTGCNEEERNTASMITEVMKESRSVEKIAEGEESEEFWGFLGGKGEYATEAAGQQSEKEARLFQCTNSTGTFVVEEVYDFAQDDLIDDDVMLLDTFYNVFVWVGSQSNDTEKRMANDVAKKYVDAAQDGREKDCAVTIIQAGSEPPMFTCHFLGWDHEAANKFVDPYQAKLDSMKSFQTTAPWAKKRTDFVDPLAKKNAELKKAAEDDAKAAEAATEAPPAKAEASSAVEAGKTFSLAELQAGVNGVPPHEKESFLSDADFQEAFGMDMASFQALPKWKRQNAKKKVGLF